MSCKGMLCALRGACKLQIAHIECIVWSLIVHTKSAIYAYFLLNRLQFAWVCTGAFAPSQPGVSAQD